MSIPDAKNSKTIHSFVSVGDDFSKSSTPGRCCEVSTAADKERIEEERRQKERKEERLSWHFPLVGLLGWTAASICGLFRSKGISWQLMIGMLQDCHGVLNETYFYQLDFSTKQVVQTLRWFLWCRNGGPKGEKRSRSNGRETWWQRNAKLKIALNFTIPKGN